MITATRSTAKRMTATDRPQRMARNSVLRNHGSTAPSVTTPPRPVSFDEYGELSGPEQRRYEFPVAPGEMARIFDGIDAIEALSAVRDAGESGMLFDLESRLCSPRMSGSMVNRPTESEAFRVEVSVSPKIVVDGRGDVFAGVAAALREHAERLQHLAMQIDAAAVSATVDQSPGLVFEVFDTSAEAVIFSSASRAEASRFAASQAKPRDHYQLRARPV